jgi:hypothetical protein
VISPDHAEGVIEVCNASGVDSSRAWASARVDAARFCHQHGSDPEPGASHFGSFAVRRRETDLPSRQIVGLHSLPEAGDAADEIGVMRADSGDTHVRGAWTRQRSRFSLRSFFSPTSSPPDTISVADRRDQTCPVSYQT